MSAAIIKGLGALLKYETHHLFHPNASVLVQCTSEEWAAFQKALADGAGSAHPLVAAAMEIAPNLSVNPRADGRVDVGFAAGDYHKLGEAHEQAKTDAPEEHPSHDEHESGEEHKSDEPSLV